MFKNVIPKVIPELDLLNTIYKFQLHGIFPEICTPIRIFCTRPVTVAKHERAFSKLSAIKNFSSSSMLQERLNGLVLLSIKHDLTIKIDYDKVIKDFASHKVRK